jgi:hypothetical protein
MTAAEIDANHPGYVLAQRPAECAQAAKALLSVDML